MPTLSSIIPVPLQDSAISNMDIVKLLNAGGAAGDTIYWNGSNFVRLAKGTATQVLAMNAGATAPTWTNAGALQLIGSATSNGSVSTLTVSGIATGYKILKIFCYGDFAASTDLTLTFNGDSGNNYSDQITDMQTTTVQTGHAEGRANVRLASCVSGDRWGGEVTVFQFSTTSPRLTSSKFAVLPAATTVYDRLVSGKWNNSANEITSVTISNSSAANFSSSTTMVIYGM